MTNPTNSGQAHQGTASLTAGAEEQNRVEQLVKAFEQKYGASPDLVVRAPGRINLIGEHVDYSGGFVLPLAIDRTVLVAARSAARTPGTIHVTSLDYNSEGDFDAAHIVSINKPNLRWLNYVQGMVWALEQRGLLREKALPAADLLVTGNVPQGAGLSSSAAIEMATALTFLLLAGYEAGEIDRAQMALAGQYNENKFLGVNSGIMDQFIIALGQPESALLINTRSLEYRLVPLGLNDLHLKIVAVDSAVPHSHGSSGYNQRRAECEEALRLLVPLLNLPSNALLCDITPEQFNTVENELPTVLRKRARHVILENARVLKAVALLEAAFQAKGELKEFGQLINQSHYSLRDDFEVSVPEVDLLVDLAQNLPGVIGARMTGGGFGGCTVNIVEEKALPEFERQVFQAYRAQTGLDARLYICEGVGGASPFNF